jgi:hypothetical protein
MATNRKALPMHMDGGNPDDKRAIREDMSAILPSSKKA